MRQSLLFAPRTSALWAFSGYLWVATLYCAGVVYAILSATLLRFSLWDTVGCCAVFLAALCGVTHNKWTLLATLGALVLGGLTLLATGQLAGLLAYVRDTGDIVFKNRFDDLYARGMFAFICLLCAVYTTLFLRLWMRFMPLFLLGLTVFVYELIFGIFDAPAAFVMFALSMVLVLCLHPGGRRFRAHMPRAAVFGRGAHAVLPLCAAAVLLGACVAAPLSERSAVRVNMSAREFAYSLSERLGAYDFDFSKTGFNPHPKRLGGDIASLDHTPILQVRAGFDAQRLYLIGAVKSTYSGTRWTYTGEEHPLDVTAGGGTGNGGVQITSLRGKMRTLFLPGMPQRVQMGRRNAYESGVGERWVSPPFDKGDSYTVYLADNSAERYRRDFGDYYFYSDYAAFAATPSAPMELSPYLQLPDRLPDRVRTLAEEIIRDATTDYARAKAIETYLRGYTYTFSPGEVPGGRDMADYFLFDKPEGYCTYFATAFCVLARAAGLPTRYAEGYATQGDLWEGVTVTNAQAHAWPEVWLPGAAGGDVYGGGWVQFEPTAPYAAGLYGDGMTVHVAPDMANSAGFSRHMRELGVPQELIDVQLTPPRPPRGSRPSGGTTAPSVDPSGTGATDDPRGDPTEPFDPGDPTGGGRVTSRTAPPTPGGTGRVSPRWYAVIAAVLAAAVVLLWRLCRRRDVAEDADDAAVSARPLAPDKAFAAAHLRGIVRLMSLGVPRRKQTLRMRYESPAQCVRRQRALYADVFPLEEAATAYEDAYYGDKPLSAAQRRLLADSRERLRRHMRRTLGRARYGWRMVMR